MNAPAPITTTTELTVPWVLFRQALCAVLPHIAKSKDSIVLNRLRIEVRPTGEVFVSATNRFTAALARIEAFTFPTEGRRLDLHGEEVRKILAVFPEVHDEATDYTLHLVASADQLEVRDVSGMVDGERVTVNLTAELEDFPDLPRQFARWTHRPPVDISRTAFALENFALFKAALKCFGDGVLSMSLVGGHAVLIVIEDVFIGFASGQDRAEEVDRDRDRWAGVLDADLPPADRLNPLEGVVDITDWAVEIPDEKDSD
ncbi:MAG: hypothetical protein ACI39C_07315 [Dietzia sp.]